MTAAVSLGARGKQMERIRRKSKRPEDAIQRAVFQHLKARAAPNVFAFHVPNGGQRKPIEAAILKGLGVTAGVPDIIAIKDGKAFGLELKADGGKVTPKQLDTMKAMALSGATVGVTHGLDEALQWLESHGILRGVSVTQRFIERIAQEHA